MTVHTCKDANPLELQRRKRIAAIKTVQRQMGMDDATYRAMLAGQTGKCSATQLTLPELGKVLDYMRRQGGKSVRDGGRTRLIPTAERAALMRKVHALLSDLGRVTGETYTLNYADAICKRNHWCERVDFASPVALHQLVGALQRTLMGKAAKRQEVTV